jgi:uncharacterized protein
MTNIHRAQLAHTAPQPWRNGGGSTRELLAWPQVQAWQVRVSVARIDADGPFSAFPGVDRWFAVLAGAGVVLALPEGQHRLSPGSRPLAFDGALAPGCTLVGGPTDDLNLMVRRGIGQGEMWRAEPGASIDGATRWRAVYAAGPVAVDIDFRTEMLAAGELLWSDSADPEPWLVHGTGPAFCMAVR